MSYLFHGQRRDEDVVLVSRQHPFVLLRPMTVSVVILLVPFLVNVFMNFNAAWVAVFVVCLIVSILHAALAWFGWNNSMLLLTNERVVWLHQRGLLHREFSECGLGSIQQVSHELNGLLHTLMGYGHIKIQTGGSQQPFELPNIPDPYEIQQEIQRAANGEGFVEEEEAEEEEVTV